MRKKRLTFNEEVLVAFSWLETEFEYLRGEFMYAQNQGKNVYLLESITYKKNDAVFIKISCDKRDTWLNVEIYINANGIERCIMDSMDPWMQLGNKLDYPNATCESIFNYTEGVFDAEGFMQVRREPERRRKKRGELAAYVDTYSQLLRAALPAIEAKLL